MAEVPLLPASECSSDQSFGKDIAVPEFAFPKQASKEIERLRTEIGGAAFASKIFKPEKSKKSKADESVVALSDLLQPPKKKQRAAPKAGKKAAAKAKPGDNSQQESTTDIMADVEQTTGVNRKRWWIDDVLAALIHAAGGLTMLYFLF